MLFSIKKKNENGKGKYKIYNICLSLEIYVSILGILEVYNLLTCYTIEAHVEKNNRKLSVRCTI